MIEVMDQSLFIPEVLLRNYIIEFQDKIKASIESNPDDNIITRMFKGFESVGELNYVQEAKDLFLNYRPIEVKFGFNLESVDKIPHAHIILPAEQTDFIPIGGSEGLMFEDEGSTEAKEVIDQQMRTKYSIMLINKNADILIIVYNVFKYMFLSYLYRMETDGFQNVRLSGSDYVSMRDMVPQSIYSRNIDLDFSYQMKAISDTQELRGRGYNIYESKIEIEGA